MQDDSSPGRAPKHRACDECRTRKLACSKDPSGCARCKREGIPCVYSPQKPMGRPRKRRAAEEPAGEEVVMDGSRPPVSHGSDKEISFTQDMDFSSQASESAGVNYLDLVSNDFGDVDDTLLYSFSQSAFPDVFGPGDDEFIEPTFPLEFHGTEILQGIDINEPDPPHSTVSKDISDSLQHHLSTHIPPQEETSPSTLSGTSSAGESPASSTDSAPQKLRPLPNATCGCLSSLYLGLESLNHLPSDVPSAMRVARSATKVAQDVLDCPQCANCFFRDPLQPPPVQALQNMMCLGALMPSACNAYAAILEMIDDETDAAKKRNEKIFFSFRDIGGLWGLVAGEQGGSCRALQAYDKRELDPDVWRETARSIVRLDVYGLGGKTGDSPMGRQAQRGLKDVVNHLDRTAKVRHDMMDEMVAAGRMPRHSRYLLHYHAPIPLKQRNCVRLVESARMALDSLVIQ